MSSWLTRTKQMIGSTLKLPEDLLLDLPRTTWIGSFLLHIENHKGLIRVEKEIISIKVFDGRIIITGNALQIQSMDAEEMVIKGEIDQVEYKRQQGGEKE
ncbi:sporulation protein YqfC [Jeotgalibacillus sp. S-D1]|uniref:sporulation protein YqfC n=1 Tax=Jeotgalibacillus sp. S-D1 TaxID=2552189 RepID=UPI00105A15F3|nr:sporulation protein YqfC [Jeotgalibacillus sp. S-D1]TDL34503.1 sporulation protein YqfC [Jeotgalibacillus sp. S-D1]